MPVRTLGIEPACACAGVGEGHATDVRPADCRELCASGVRKLMLMLMVGRVEIRRTVTFYVVV